MNTPTAPAALVPGTATAESEPNAEADSAAASTDTRLLADRIPLDGAGRVDLARQRHVVAALRLLLPEHAVLYREEDTRPYECDGLTIYRQVPMVVVLPETEAQVVQVLQLCNREQVPVVPRGAFYGFLDIGATRLGSLDFARRALAETAVAVVPGITFGPASDRFVRVALTVPDAMLRDGLRRLRRLAESLMP